MTGSIYNWSTTASNNGNADAGINFAEGQQPSSVNDSARQVMGRLAELLADMGGALTAGGTANALTVATASAFTAYQDGLILAVRIASSNTTATTLNANGIGAKSVRKMLASGESALVGGEQQATGICIYRYATALNSGAGGWMLLNPVVDYTVFATKTGAETLTNKTLTSPAINTPAINGGTVAGAAVSGGTVSGSAISTTAITLEQSATPTPTAEGRIQWDTDDNILAVGDGAATQLFVPIPASTAAGDTEYYTAAKVKARLAKGTAGQRKAMNDAATAPQWSDNIAQSASVDTSTGATSYDVTGIPSWARRVTVLMQGIGFNGSELAFRVGSPGGGILAAGYTGASAYIANSTNTGVVTNSDRFRFSLTAGPVDGSCVFNRLGTGNVWVQNLYAGTTSSTTCYLGGGKIDLGANALDRIRVTTANGTATGNAGSMLVYWE